MSDRDFTDSVKFEIVKANLDKYKGSVICEACGKKMASISECHFDHIFPYAKGGKSNLDNCQILCSECNLKKNDKLIQDFLLEEQSRQFLSGGNCTAMQQHLKDTEQNIEDRKVIDNSNKITKERFDEIIRDFINKKGDIHKVDFTREYNHLPSIHYANKYYGDLNSMKKEFGIIDMSLNWNRENIKKALLEYVEKHGYIVQNDMKKKNGLPSIPCVLSYYPEYNNFTDIKEKLCGLDSLYKIWDLESVLSAGKEFLKTHDVITEKDLSKANGLPTSKVVYRLFNNINDFQKTVGSKVTTRNTYIPKEQIHNLLDEYFEGKERIVESSKVLFNSINISPSCINKRYGTIENFAKEENFIILNSRKAVYTKREVDDVISNWIKNGNNIPKMKDLTKLGLPSQAVILKYYEDWKTPFYMYIKMYEEVNRHE